MNLGKKHSVTLIAAGLVVVGGLATWYFYFSVPGLRSQLHSSSQDTRCAAARRLAARGRDARVALPELEAMLDNTECYEFSKDALPEWIDELGGTEAWFDVARKGGTKARRHALRYLGHALFDRPERSEGLKELFAASLEDEDAWIRYHAVAGLAAFRGRASGFAPALQRHLYDPDPGVRKQVVGALDSMRSLDGLRAAASNPDAEVRAQAMAYVGKLAGEDSGYAFRVATEVYNSALTSPELSEYGRRRLARLTDPPQPEDYVGYGAEALPILIQGLDDESAIVSGKAAAALAGLGRQSLPALEALERTALNSPDANTRLQALGALANIGPEGRPTLERAVNDSDQRVRDYATSTLRLMDQQSQPQ